MNVRVYDSHICARDSIEPGFQSLAASVGIPPKSTLPTLPRFKPINSRIPKTAGNEQNRLGKPNDQHLKDVVNNKNGQEYDGVEPQRMILTIKSISAGNPNAHKNNMNGKENGDAYVDTSSYSNNKGILSLPRWQSDTKSLDNQSSGGAAFHNSVASGIMQAERGKGTDMNSVVADDELLNASMNIQDYSPISQISSFNVPHVTQPKPWVPKAKSPFFKLSNSDEFCFSTTFSDSTESKDQVPIVQRSALLPDLMPKKPPLSEARTALSKKLGRKSGYPATQVFDSRKTATVTAVAKSEAARPDNRSESDDQTNAHDQKGIQQRDSKDSSPDNLRRSNRHTTAPKQPPAPILKDNQKKAASEARLQSPTFTEGKSQQQHAPFSRGAAAPERASSHNSSSSSGMVSSEFSSTPPQPKYKIRPSVTTKAQSVDRIKSSRSHGKSSKADVSRKSVSSTSKESETSLSENAMRTSSGSTDCNRIQMRKKQPPVKWKAPKIDRTTSISSGSFGKRSEATELSSAMNMNEGTKNSSHDSLERSGDRFVQDSSSQSEADRAVPNPVPAKTSSETVALSETNLSMSMKEQTREANDSHAREPSDEVNFVHKVQRPAFASSDSSADFLPTPKVGAEQGGPASPVHIKIPYKRQRSESPTKTTSGRKHFVIKLKQYDIDFSKASPKKTRHGSASTSPAASKLTIAERLPVSKAPANDQEHRTGEDIRNSPERLSSSPSAELPRAPAHARAYSETQDIPYSITVQPIFKPDPARKFPFMHESNAHVKAAQKLRSLSGSGLKPSTSFPQVPTKALGYSKLTRLSRVKRNRQVCHLSSITIIPADTTKKIVPLEPMSSNGPQTENSKSQKFMGYVNGQRDGINRLENGEDGKHDDAAAKINREHELLISSPAQNFTPILPQQTGDAEEMHAAIDPASEKIDLSRRQSRRAVPAQDLSSSYIGGSPGPVLQATDGFSEFGSPHLLLPKQVNLQFGVPQPPQYQTPGVPNNFQITPPHMSSDYHYNNANHILQQAPTYRPPSPGEMPGYNSAYTPHSGQQLINSYQNVQAPYQGGAYYGSPSLAYHIGPQAPPLQFMQSPFNQQQITSQQVPGNHGTYSPGVYNQMPIEQKYQMSPSVYVPTAPDEAPLMNSPQANESVEPKNPSNTQSRGIHDIPQNPATSRSKSLSSFAPVRVKSISHPVATRRGESDGTLGKTHNTVSDVRPSPAHKIDADADADAEPDPKTKYGRGVKMTAAIKKHIPKNLLGANAHTEISSTQQPVEKPTVVPHKQQGLSKIGVATAPAAPPNQDMPITDKNREPAQRSSAVAPAFNNTMRTTLFNPYPEPHPPKPNSMLSRLVHELENEATGAPQDMRLNVLKNRQNHTHAVHILPAPRPQLRLEMPENLHFSAEPQDSISADKIVETLIEVQHDIANLKEHTTLNLARNKCDLLIHLATILAQTIKRKTNKSEGAIGLALDSPQKHYRAILTWTFKILKSHALDYYDHVQLINEAGYVFIRINSLLNRIYAKQVFSAWIALKVNTLMIREFNFTSAKIRKPIDTLFEFYSDNPTMRFMAIEPIKMNGSTILDYKI